MNGFINFVRNLPSRLKSIDKAVTESIHDSFWKTASLESRNGYRSQKTSELVDSLAREISDQIEKNEVELCEFEQDDAQPGHIVADEIFLLVQAKHRGDEPLDTTVWLPLTFELFPRKLTCTVETYDEFELSVQCRFCGFRVVRENGRDREMVAYSVREVSVISSPDRSAVEVM